MRFENEALVREGPPVGQGEGLVAARVSENWVRPFQFFRTRQQARSEYILQNL